MRKYSQNSTISIGDSQQAAPQIMELEREVDDRTEVLYIRLRGAELTLPAETGIEAIATVLRSLQQL